MGSYFSGIGPTHSISDKQQAAFFCNFNYLFVAEPPGICSQIFTNHKVVLVVVANLTYIGRSEEFKFH
jgi:hypothetical protein